MLGGVAVGDNLIIGDQNIAVDAHVLVLNAMKDAAEIMAQMQTTRGAVAGEHGVFLGMNGKIGADLVGAVLACKEGIGKFSHSHLSF